VSRFYQFKTWEYRIIPDISPLFEMGLTRCARASVLRVSVAAIERRLIRRLGGGSELAPPELSSMLDVDLYKTPHKDQVNRNRRGNNGERRSQFRYVKCT